MSGGDREGERKLNADEVPILSGDIETRAPLRPWDKSGGYPVYWPGGVRHEGVASPVCGFRTERERAGPDIAVRRGAGGERESIGRREP